MARLPRLYMEGCSQHIIQRGNNRQACFFADDDYAFYLDKLQQASEKYTVATSLISNLEVPARGDVGLVLNSLSSSAQDS